RVLVAAMLRPQCRGHAELYLGRLALQHRDEAVVLRARQRDLGKRAVVDRHGVTPANEGTRLAYQRAHRGGRAPSTQEVPPARCEAAAPFRESESTAGARSRLPQ